MVESTWLVHIYLLVVYHINLPLLRITSNILVLRNIQTKYLLEEVLENYVQNEVKIFFFNIDVRVPTTES